VSCLREVVDNNPYCSVPFWTAGQCTDEIHSDSHFHSGIGKGEGVQPSSDVLPSLADTPNTLLYNEQSLSSFSATRTAASGLGTSLFLLDVWNMLIYELQTKLLIEHLLSIHKFCHQNGVSHLHGSAYPSSV